MAKGSEFLIQGARVWSLDRQLDPACHSEDPVQPNKKWEKKILKGSI